MKILYLDLGMGVAGDMLSASLLDLLDDKAEFIKEFNNIGIPNVTAKIETNKKCGITGIRFSVSVAGVEEGERHHHHSDFDCGIEDEHHHHHHTSLADIEQIIDKLKVSDKVKTSVKAVYKSIAEAESHVHGEPVYDIHFHEVGTMDAVADITCTAMLIEKLGVDRVLASPINVGSGTVFCAHGILPVPAPATVQILKGLPIYSSGIKGELTTPTGAALVKNFVSEFGDMPQMAVSAVGYGMGKKDFERANCVRAIIGETKDLYGSVLEISANIDDMTGEELSFAMERLLNSGALDVYFTPIYMKKSRPAVKLSLLCKPQDREKFVKLILEYTTTLGVRIAEYERPEMDRTIETIETPYGVIRKKVAQGYGVTKEKFEYEDLSEIAKQQGIPLKELLEKIR